MSFQVQLPILYTHNIADLYNKNWSPLLTIGSIICQPYSKFAQLMCLVRLCKLQISFFVYPEKDCWIFLTMMSPKQTTNGSVYIRCKLICQIFSCPGTENELYQPLCVSSQRTVLFFFSQDLHATRKQCATSFLNIIKNYINKKTNKKTQKYIVR